VLKLLCDLLSVSLPLVFLKICLSKRKWYPKKPGKTYGNPPKPKRAHNVINLSDKMKILDLLKGGMSLVEVGLCCGKYESDIHNTMLNSMHPEHSWFFLNGSLPGTIYLQIPRVYYNYYTKKTKRKTAIIQLHNFKLRFCSNLNGL
jgi:hypothetical protein